MELTVKHIGPCSGTVEVNESIVYSNAKSNVVSFPSPELDVDCGIIICPERCPQPVELTVGGCEDCVRVDASDLRMVSLGRIVQFGVTIRNVCPDKRVALGVLLSEVDDQGNEYKRGMKAMTIPAHHEQSCRDVSVCNIEFVLSEDLDVSGSPCAICNDRPLRACFIVHYIDNDFYCCYLIQ